MNLIKNMNSGDAATNWLIDQINKLITEFNNKSFESGGGPVTIDWGDISGVPLTFPPTSHTHSFNDLDNIPEAFPPASHNHEVNWNDILNRPQTVGILTKADAMTDQEISTSTSSLFQTEAVNVSEGIIIKNKTIITKGFVGQSGDSAKSVTLVGCNVIFMSDTTASANHNIRDCTVTFENCHIYGGSISVSGSVIIKKCFSYIAELNIEGSPAFKIDNSSVTYMNPKWNTTTASGVFYWAGQGGMLAPLVQGGIVEGYKIIIGVGIKTYGSILAAYQLSPTDFASGQWTGANSSELTVYEKGQEGSTIPTEFFN